jgi:DNA polymerase alpha-associated DNA helicase A
MELAMNQLLVSQNDHPVIPILFNTNNSVFLPNEKTSQQQIEINFEPFDTTMNQSQLEAISFALEKSRSIALIHGPPGTGKTTTIVEFIRQCVLRGEKVILS